MPSFTKRRCIHAMSTSRFVSITPMAPKTRTSATCGSIRAGSNSLRSCASMRSTFSCQPYDNNRSIEAHATEQANGLPINVGPCINTRGSHDEMPSATLALASTAENVIYPPVSALPMHIMSGSTPACSQANSFPVRPKPVAISSKSNRTPYSRHSFAASRRYCG